MKKISLALMTFLIITAWFGNDAFSKAKGKWACYCEDEESFMIMKVDKETAFAYREHHIDDTGHEHINCFPIED